MLSLEFLPKSAKIQRKTPRPKSVDFCDILGYGEPPKKPSRAAWQEPHANSANTLHSVGSPVTDFGALVCLVSQRALEACFRAPKGPENDLKNIKIIKF